MAIDTTAKYISAGQCGMPFEVGIIPNGTSTLSTADKIAAVWEYSGITPYSTEGFIYTVRVLTDRYKMTSIEQGYNFRTLNDKYKLVSRNE